MGPAKLSGTKNVVQSSYWSTSTNCWLTETWREVYEYTDTDKANEALNNDIVNALKDEFATCKSPVTMMANAHIILYISVVRV